MTFNLSKLERILVYAGFTALLVVLTFFDYSLTTSLYEHASFFGRIFYLLGEAPFQLLAIYSASLMLFFRDKTKSKKNTVLLVLTIALIVALSIYGGGQFTSYMNRLLGKPWRGIVKYALFLAFGIPYFLLAFPFAYWTKKKLSDNKLAFAYGACVVMAYLGILVLMNLLKMIAFRPRYRLLVQVYEGEALASHWRPWYAFQTLFAKSNYLSDLNEAGVNYAMDDFFSFPSGHTMNAVGVLGVAYLPVLFGKERKFSLPLRLVCYLFGATVGFSRVFLGDHNLTDSVFGFLLGVGAIDCAFAFYFPYIKKSLGIARA